MSAFAKNTHLFVCWILLLLATSILYTGCSKPDTYENPFGKDVPSKIATDWALRSLETIKNSKSKSPTYASRALAYLGICMYQSVYFSDHQSRSLENQLPGLNNLPVIDSTQSYHWPLVLVEAQYTLLTSLYPATQNLNDDYALLLKNFRDNDVLLYSADQTPGISERSIKFGKALAMAIFDWSKSDGGYEGYRNNFDSSFKFPSGPGYWEPPIKGQSTSLLPLHPHWGKNRFFVEKNSILGIPLMAQYSTNPGSQYYKMYEQVATVKANLTSEQKDIAVWWSDDPSDTYSPPGHSYYLAALTVARNNSTLVMAAKTFAQVGMAVADAFIHCWKCKYTYFNERPGSFIRKNINFTWEPFWPEPPFPSFPSGHALQASAAAAILEKLFGPNTPLIDDLYEGKLANGHTLKSRTYSNFSAFAYECGMSRLYGGIHTLQDMEVGLNEGMKIASNIYSLQWNK